MTTIHFNALPLKDTANETIKKGLIFYSTTDESPHVDSRKVAHDFPPDRVIKLVENTNRHFETTELGIPVLTEHRKDVNNVVGFIESPLEAKVITEEYTKGNPKLKHLLGRVGVFVNDVKIKSSEIIEKMNQGLAKSVSAGIDLDSFSIKELSLVALPAIANATLFSYQNQKKGNMKRNKKNYLLLPRESNYALSIDEAMTASQTIEQQREEAQKVFTAFLEVVEDANEIDEEEMASMGIQDPSEIIQSAIEDLSARLGDMFLGMPMEEQQEPLPLQPPARQPVSPARRFSSSNDIVTFYTGQGYTAEFGYRQAISGAFKQLRNRNVTGKSVGQIGNQFASKIGNATRGKLKSVGNAIGRVKNTFTGGVMKDAASQNGGISTGLRLRKKQLVKQQNQKQKFGTKSTFRGKGPALPPGYKSPV